jgi:hypothetical protein
MTRLAAYLPNLINSSSPMACKRSRSLRRYVSSDSKPIILGTPHLGCGRGGKRYYSSRSPTLLTRRIEERKFTILICGDAAVCAKSDQGLQSLVTPNCPFVNLPELSRSRWGEGLTAEDMKKCVWVRPELVAQIEFLEWTESDHLRHSKFAGLCENKDAHTVTREHAGEG